MRFEITLLTKWQLISCLFVVTYITIYLIILPACVFLFLLIFNRTRGLPVVFSD